MSVLKQALQLMQEDLNPVDDKVKDKKRSKTKDAMKLIKTNRSGVWKELRRLQKQEQERMKSKREKKSDFKSSIEKYREDELVSEKRKTKSDAALNPVETNPSYLKKAKKVLEYHKQEIDRRYQQTEETKKEESTVFTDRDFDKFEEEYDFFK